jgi:hypothetical protein
MLVHPLKNIALLRERGSLLKLVEPPFDEFIGSLKQSFIQNSALLFNIYLVLLSVHREAELDFILLCRFQLSGKLVGILHLINSVKIYASQRCLS